MILIRFYREWRYRRALKQTAQAAVNYFGGLEAFAEQMRRERGEI